MDGSEEDISIIPCADDQPGDADNFELPNFVVADERTDPSSILALKSSFADLKNRWNISQKENTYFRRLYSLNMNRSSDQGREVNMLPISEYEPLSSSAQGAAAMSECGAESRSLTSQIMYLEHQLKQVALERQNLEVKNFQFLTKHNHLERKLKDAMDMDENQRQHIQKQDQELKALKSTVAELEGRLKEMEIKAETKHRLKILEDKMASAKILEYAKSDTDSPGYIMDLSACNDALEQLEEAVRQQYSVINAVRRQMASVTTDGIPTSPRPEALGSSSRNLFEECTSPKHPVVTEHDELVRIPEAITVKPHPASWVKGEPCQLSDGSEVSHMKKHPKPSKEILYTMKSNNSHQAQVSSSDTATAELVLSSSAHNRESNNIRTKYEILNNSEKPEKTTKVEPNKSNKSILRPRSCDSSSSDSNASNNHKLVAKRLSEATALSHHAQKANKDVVPIRKNHGEEPKGKERNPPPDATETALTVQLCPLCTEDFSRLTMEEFQNHVFNCFVKGDEIEKPTAAANKDHMCPMCSAIFPEQVPQEEFEAHVQQHFEGQITDRFEILPSPN